MHDVWGARPSHTPPVSSTRTVAAKELQRRQPAKELSGEAVLDVGGAGRADTNGTTLLASIAGQINARALDNGGVGPAKVA